MNVKARWDQPQTWTAPGTVHEVMGARAPVVTHTMRTFHSGSIEFWTPIDAEFDIIQLFADGTPILVNPPVCCTPVLRYEWTWGDLTAKLAGDDVTGRSGWWWTYNYQRVGTPGRVRHQTNGPRQHLRRCAGRAVPPRLPVVPDRARARTPTTQEVLTTPHPHLVP